MRNLLLSLILMLLTATIGLGWALDRLYRETQKTQPAVTDASQVIESFGRELAGNLDGNPDRANVVTLMADNENFSLSLMPMADFPMPEPLIEQLKRGEPLILESSEQLTYHYYLSHDDDLLILRSPLLRDAKNSQLIFTLLFYVLLVIVFTGWAYSLIRQLKLLSNKAKKFGEGQLDSRVVTSRFSYIGDIEKEFNQMASRIESLVADVKLLSSAVSHDLRTPLSRIRFGFDTLAEEEDADRREYYLKKIDADIVEMESLVETLLSYSRLDQAMLHLDKQLIDASKLLEEVSSQYQMNEAMITIELDLRPGMHIEGDITYIAMVINNLIQNAINHAKSVVGVTLAEIGQKVQISITDDGQGVSDDQRDEIIKPFVRGKKESAETYTGHGMGLAIVTRILGWHDSHLDISNCRKLGGARFSFTLSRVESDT